MIVTEVTGLKLDITHTAKYISSVSGISHGNITWYLYRGTTELKKATISGKELGSGNVDPYSFNQGTEGDNGSTATKIVYTLDSTALTNGEYTFVMEFSGKGWVVLEIPALHPGNYFSFSGSGQGSASAVME